MKKLALLSIFLALPLMAQAPSDTDLQALLVSYAKKQFTIERMQEQIAQVQTQLAKAKDPQDCVKQLLVKGHDEAVAIQNFQKASMPAVNGVSPQQEMFKAAEEFLRIEKTCVQK